MSETEIVRISARSNRLGYWRQCWDYRELVWFLARRDLVVRYRQTIVGVLWLFARPASQVIVLTILLGEIAELPNGGLPYPVLVMSGAVLWHSFACIVNESTTALTNNHNLITKVHFPRLLLPIGSVAANLVDLTINLMALLALMLWFQTPTHWWLVLSPLPLLMVMTTGLGLGLWFCAGCVRYRDFRQMAPYSMQILFLLSPIGFASALIPDRLAGWEWLYYLNPIAVAVDYFRFCVFADAATGLPTAWQTAVACLIGLSLLVSGQAFFRQQERQFSDVI